MKHTKYRSYAILLCMLLWALAMVGCEQKSINDIRAEPGRYANRDVAVVGTVTRSFSVLGRGVYEIEDGTGKLWVVSEKGVPRQGAKVLVKGKVRDAFDLSAFITLPERISSGLVMMEDSHRAR